MNENFDLFLENKKYPIAYKGQKSLMFSKKEVNAPKTPPHLV